MAVASFGIVPIVEELFFRGYVQTRLTDAFGVPAAIVMTAVAFMLAHGQYFLPTIIAGYVRYRWGTVLPGMTAHALGNVPVRGLVRWFFSPRWS